MIGIFTQDDSHATDLMITGNTPEQAILHKPTVNEYIFAETNTHDTVLKDKTEDDNCIKFTAKDYLTETDVGIITEFIPTLSIVGPYGNYFVSTGDIFYFHHKYIKIRT